MLFGSSTGGIPGKGPARSDDAALDGGTLVVGVLDVDGAAVEGELDDEFADEGAVGVDVIFATG